MSSASTDAYASSCISKVITTPSHRPWDSAATSVVAGPRAALLRQLVLPSPCSLVPCAFPSLPRCLLTSLYPQGSYEFLEKKDHPYIF